MNKKGKKGVEGDGLQGRGSGVVCIREVGADQLWECALRRGRGRVGVRGEPLGEQWGSGGSGEGNPDFPGSQWRQGTF